MFKRMVLVFAALTTTLPVVAQNDAAALPEGAGKAVIQRMCVGCHQISVITAKRATKEQWSTLVQQMVSRGADGSDEDINIVVDYLSKNFPATPDKTAPATTPAPASTPPAPQSSLRQPDGPNAWQSASLLTMSHADLEAMLHSWNQSLAHIQPTYIQENVKQKKRTKIG
jgi:hypothetical protein